jgi:hypothetical protein
MQWPTTELVFTLFPTLLLLMKKRAAPDTHGLAISVIYCTDSISSMFVCHASWLCEVLIGYTNRTCHLRANSTLHNTYCRRPRLRLLHLNVDCVPHKNKWRHHFIIYRKGWREGATHVSNLATAFIYSILTNLAICLCLAAHAD